MDGEPEGRRPRLFSPPKNQSYEPPVWAPGGAVFFVRRVANGNGQPYGPIATVGAVTGPYGHYDSWSAADWHQ